MAKDRQMAFDLGRLKDRAIDRRAFVTAAALGISGFWVISGSKQIQNLFRNMLNRKTMNLGQNLHEHLPSETKLPKLNGETDVIITNLYLPPNCQPDYQAVILRNIDQTILAPTVIAKAENVGVLKIIEAGILFDVSEYDRKPLARSLFVRTEIGNSIVQEDYESVAEVYATHYRTYKSRHLRTYEFELVVL